MLPGHSELVRLLPNVLNGLLPGVDAHRTMAPYPARIKPETISVEGKDAREAATLVLLYPYLGGEETALVLTARQPGLRDHSGQISLPGGSRDGSETAEETALREGWEEVGVPAEHPTVLGRLSPIHIPPSGFSVFPVVASVDYAPPFQIQETEVAALLEVPLSHLLDPSTRQTSTRKIGGSEFEAPFFAVDNHEVWGATAMMLAEFVAVLRSIT
jgi:8-oxo-dGTP pyrophosphatase MutT (NUDIX family)